MNEHSMPPKRVLRVVQFDGADLDEGSQLLQTMNRFFKGRSVVDEERNDMGKQFVGKLDEERHESEMSFHNEF